MVRSMRTGLLAERIGAPFDEPIGQLGLDAPERQILELGTRTLMGKRSDTTVEKKRLHR
jgi:hypothetical protein